MSTTTTLYRTTRFIWYIFYVIETLLVLRFALKLLGANAGAAFTQFVYTLSAPFVAPFMYVFGSPSVAGSVFELSTLLALFVYWLLAWGIVKLIVMNRSVSHVEAQHSVEAQDNA